MTHPLVDLQPVLEPHAKVQLQKQVSRQKLWMAVSLPHF